MPLAGAKVIAVGSGKGGVGKSTITANLAFALKGLGYKVGVIDADIYGFSLVRLMGLDQEQPAPAGDGMMLPLEREGVKIISTGNFVREGEAIIWRGPLLVKALDQFINGVQWGDLDYMLIDLPPGTGDVPLTIMQKLPQVFLLLVTTPQASAAHVAGRLARMAQQAKVRMLGIVENMSYFECEHGQRYYLFGQGESQKLAEGFELPVLGRIPLRMDIRETSDEGRPAVLTVPEIAREFEQIAIGVGDVIKLAESPGAQYYQQRQED